MKLNHINSFSTNSVSFKGSIIDAHAHIGNWDNAIFRLADMDKFVKSPLSNGDTVEKVILSNLSCIEQNGILDEVEGNVDLLNKIKGSDKYAPLAVCQPGKGNVENIKTLFKKHPKQFVGLKFHPDSLKLLASDDAYVPYLEFAKNQKLPCVFHTGIAYQPNSPEFVLPAERFSSPLKVYELAKKVPKVPVVMAHMGAGGERVHNFAIDALINSINSGDATLYADISWVDCDNPSKPNIIKAISKLQNTTKGDMTSRLLFGSDAPIGEFSAGFVDSAGNKLSGKQFYEKSVIDTKNAIKKSFPDEADDLIDKIFYRNAKELFFNPTEVVQDVAETVVETAAPNSAQTATPTNQVSQNINDAAEQVHKKGKDFINKSKEFLKKNKTACIAFAGVVATVGIVSVAVITAKKMKAKKQNMQANTPLMMNNAPKVFSNFSTFA